MKKIKYLPWIIVGAWILIIFSLFFYLMTSGDADLLHALFRYLPKIFWGLGISLGVLMLGLFVFIFMPSIIAAQFAYKTAHRLYLYPGDKTDNGILELEIHNKGDGAIQIGHVGFLDRKWVRTGKRESTLTDMPIYYEGAKLPIRIERGEVGRVELKLNGVSFERKFTGVFYDIDCKNSDTNNKHSKLLSTSKVRAADVPEFHVRKKAMDGRLQKTFSIKKNRDKK